MSLTSEQAKALSAAPRMTPEVVDQAVSMYAEGATDAEVHERFPTWAAGTFRNLRGRKKAEIDDLRRARTVQFSDIAGVRKQARLNDYWDLRTAYLFLFKAHLESCYAVNPVTGEREFVEQLVDARKLKMYSAEVRSALKQLMIETGQQVQLDKSMTREALGLDGKNGIDYPQIVAELPERERKAAVDREWREHEYELSLYQMDARHYGPEHAEEKYAERADRKAGMTVAEAERAQWQRRSENRRWESYGRLEEFCVEVVAAELAENPHADLAALAEELKAEEFPQCPDDPELQAKIHAKVDAFFAQLPVGVPVVLEQPDPHLQFRHADLQDRLAERYEARLTRHRAT
jgi:hypothetical protein